MRFNPSTYGLPLVVLFLSASLFIFPGCDSLSEPDSPNTSPSITAPSTSASSSSLGGDAQFNDCALLRVQISGASAEASVEVMEGCEGAIAPHVIEASYERRAGTQMKPLSLSIALENATSGDEYGEPAAVVLDLADLEIVKGPPGRGRAGKPYVEASGSDGMTADSDPVPGAPYWHYNGLLDEADAEPVQRLEPGEQSGAREIALSVHAGVQEFTLPLHPRMCAVVVSKVLGSAGGRLEHPDGAYIDVPEGFGFEARMSLEQLPDDGEENTISGMFQVEVAPVGVEANSALQAAQKAAAATAATSEPQWLQVGLTLDQTISSTDQIRAEVKTSTPAQSVDEDLWYAVNLALQGQATVESNLGFRGEAISRFKLRHGLRKTFDGCVEEGFLEAPEDEDASSATAHVVYLHGWKAGLDDCVLFNAEFDPEDEGGPLFAHLNREDGLAMAAKYWRFTYASFNAIDQSAELLASKLEERFTEDERVVLVGHSMGGLVARAATERYGADTYVDRIITLGTPHEGSEAAIKGFWDLRGARLGASANAFQVFGLAPDPLVSEGSRDLQPGDNFFNDLGYNSVPLFTFAGDIGPGSNYECLHDILGFIHGFSCISYRVADEIFREQLDKEGSDGAAPYHSAKLADDFHESEFGAGYDHTDLRRGRDEGCIASEDPDECDDPLLSHVAELVAEEVLQQASQFEAWHLLTAGVTHTCGLSDAGEAYCWGLNKFGQVGDGTTSRRHTPTKVSSSIQFASITAGSMYTCGLTDEGEAYCWGVNDFGQLGDDTITDRHTPTAVATSLRFASIVAGPSHTCGLTNEGEAYCWGWNQYGQIGDGTIAYRRQTPTKVATSVRFASVEASQYHTCGLTETGEAYCWGDNRYGQLGDGTIRTRRKNPTRVATSLQFASLAVGRRHTCGLTETGEAYCWGRNHAWQLGDGTTTHRQTPTKVASSLRFATLYGGSAHSCGRTGEGEVYCWGANGRGQLGDGTTTFRQSPTPVATSFQFASVTAGWLYNCGLSGVGEAFCWGWNKYGQLGDGTSTNRLTPVPVIDPSAPVAQ